MEKFRGDEMSWDGTEDLYMSLEEVVQEKSLKDLENMIHSLKTRFHEALQYGQYDLAGDVQDDMSVVERAIKKNKAKK